MTTTYFEEMMAGFGAKPHGKLAFGVYRGRPYSAELLGPGAGPQFALRFALERFPREEAKALRAQKLQYIRWLAEQGENGGSLVALFTVPSDFYVKAVIMTALKAAATALDAASLAEPAVCPLCGESDCDTYAYLENDWRGAHAACLDTRLELPDDDDTAPRKLRGHVATGILGALVGAFIGALPVWALALSRGQIYWVMYAFIPLLSGLMYRTCRGKAHTAVAGLSVLGASLLATLALEQVWYWMVLSVEVGRTVPFWLSVRTYFQAKSFFSAVRDMLFCLIALMIGYVATTILLRRYAGEGLERAVTTRGAAFVRETAEPIAPPDPPPPENAPEKDELDD